MRDVCCIQICHGNSMELHIDMLSTNFSHRAELTHVTNVRTSTDFRQEQAQSLMLYKLLQMNNVKNSEDGEDGNS